VDPPAAPPATALSLRPAATRRVARSSGPRLGRRGGNATLLLAGLLLAACSAGDGRDPGLPEAQVQASTRSVAELEALYRARTDSIRGRVSEADVRFMTNMIPHHAQALEMARMAEPRGAGAEVQLLSARIINAQTDEIALMQQWLRDRGRPVPQLHVTETGHGAGHDGHTDHATGMLTTAQLRELEQARGLEFDRLFLVFMIQHHRGAITMVEDLLGSDGAAHDPTISTLANEISADQMTEILLMFRLLAELPTAEPHP